MKADHQVAKAAIPQDTRIFGIHGPEEGLTLREDGSVAKQKIGGEALWNFGGPGLCLPNAVLVDHQSAVDYYFNQTADIHSMVGHERRRVVERLTEQYGQETVNIWLDPDDDNPLRFMNHSCDPSALRFGAFAVFAKTDIAPGQAVMIDYSTLEANPDWQMECHCGALNCRGIIRSLQFLPPADIDQYWLKLPNFMRAIYPAPSRIPRQLAAGYSGRCWING
ncbi:SET domain-containing protein-lysine N-methyltransferase [Candidatus Falkowbacteria bacterium]|nr:SET domain-containing protein-lysine N-methyltransferase [Candidatus Falkowbacteria bacterium]